MKKGQMCEGIIEYIDFPNKEACESLKMGIV